MVRAGGGFNALVSSREGADRGGNHLVDRLTVIIPASLVDPDDILEFTLDSEPVEPPIMQLNAERVIHGEIYKARPDVLAVCHHHSAAIMPFCISGDPVVPVFHLGAAMGPVAPFWDSRDDFGDTNLLVVKPEEGASLARALGNHSMVLMRRHGATVVARSLPALPESPATVLPRISRTSTEWAGPNGGTR